MLMRPIIYRDQELEGQRLELTEEDGNYYLGPNLTLSNCTIIVKSSPKWFHVKGPRLIGCTIESKGDMKSLQDWQHAILINCTFTGRSPGCEFGGRPDSYIFTGGYIENCDFTQVRLDGCRFHHGDIQSLRLPRWPCFTLLNPLENLHQLKSVEWPGSFGSILTDGLPKHPPSTRALTLYAPSIAKRYAVTAEALKATLDKLDCVAC